MDTNVTSMYFTVLVDLVASYDAFDLGPYQLVPFHTQTSKVMVTREMFNSVTI